MQPQEMHAHWSSRLTFIMAAVGSAVGLGNFWRFPTTAGENGGGAFVLIYILCVVAVALPILMAELIIGRRGGMSAVGSCRKVAEENGRSSLWAVVGWVGMIASFLILTFYSVIGGWIIAYIPIAAIGSFDAISLDASQGRFGDLLGNPLLMTFCHGVFMALTIFIVAQGVNKGIEKAVNILMPLFFLMLVGVVIFSISTGDIGQTLAFLFAVDFSKISAPVVMDALGQAFFSIGVGSAIMITYGGYLTSATRIPFASSVICVADSFVAILAGLAIFPIVFAIGLDPATGPGLIFQTLPVAFGQMPFGSLYGTAFFLLALFAALTSSIALLEISVAWAEEHLGWSRRNIAIATGSLIWLIGIANVLSLNEWNDVFLLGAYETFAAMTIFDLLDYLTANILMPLGGVLVALFVGWRVSRNVTREELGLSDGFAFQLWRILLRYVAPISVGGVLYYLTLGSA